MTFELSCIASHNCPDAAMTAMHSVSTVRLPFQLDSSLIYSNETKGRAATVSCSAVALPGPGPGSYLEAVYHLLKRYANHEAVYKASAAILRFCSFSAWHRHGMVTPSSSRPSVSVSRLSGQGSPEQQVCRKGRRVHPVQLSQSLVKITLLWQNWLCHPGTLPFGHTK